ncbi:hypothetical protein GCM10023220_42620 [Streptomyces ziwulingensis]|uniref:Uncharacterized protein n=1 Tax=Streptomyces ziwulingensis TaxID=1045501 RepID=A0ABP9CE85_9ACTN
MAALRGRELTLRGSGEYAADPTGAENPAHVTALRGLAMAESPSVPLANLYYLAERGIWPSSHGEWLALLHHSLLGRGRSGKTLAEGLLAAAHRSTLPWHTLWSHGTGPGVATTEHLIRRPTVRRLDLVPARSDTLAVATTGRGGRSAWHLDSGEPADDPGDDAPTIPDIALRPADRNAARPGLLKRMLRTDTRLGAADFPDEAHNAPAEWFESVWGPPHPSGSRSTPCRSVLPTPTHVCWRK